MILDVVNQQIEKYFKGSAVVYQYVGVVEGFSGTFAKVRLVGHDTVFTFPVRSYLMDNIWTTLDKEYTAAGNIGETATMVKRVAASRAKTNIQVGDSVYVQCKLNNLSNGVVVDKFYGEG